jgi:predicted Holliday junction resolvase-like endonuclease
MALELIELVSGFALLLIILFVGIWIGKLLKNKECELRLPKIIDERLKKSREVLGGQFSEQLAPFLPDFPFSPTEARFMGKPIDFIIFKGMDERDIQEVVFVEVKSGKARVNAHERKLRDAIKAGRVSWYEYRVPEKVTEKKGIE